MYRPVINGDLVKILPGGNWVGTWHGLITINNGCAIMIKSSHPLGKEPGTSWNYANSFDKNPFSRERYGKCWVFEKRKESRVISWL